MKFNDNFFDEIQYYFSYKTLLSDAIEKEDIEMIKILLSNENINPNVVLILIYFFYSILKSSTINTIS